MIEQDATNRVIRLTPPGVGAIAVVRIIGPNTLPFLDRFFSRKVRHGALVHGELRDGDRVIDDPVVVLDADSRHADIHLHGGQWVTQACFELAVRHGFAIIESMIPLPDEAVDSDDAIEREMLASLPRATTDLGLRVLLSQPAAWKNLLARKDVSAPERESILKDRALHWLLHPPNVAVVGQANVGKSTLANRLFARDRSIVADLPGTTRDWVGEHANIDGLTVTLIDTPGLRDTDDPIELAAIARSGNVIGRADLVILVLDATQGPTAIEPPQDDLLARFPDAIVVANKVDKSPTFSVVGKDFVKTVANQGMGIDLLRRRIRAHFGVEGIEIDRARCWTDRQREILRY